jgi:glycosyltransferase involved in cell wall biosynthesis
VTNSQLRVLLVPDSVHWITGTIAKNIARFNPWIDATVASGPVIDIVFKEQPELLKNFDLVHFTCPYTSKEWLPRFRELVPCVTSHHHVTDWELIKHNAAGDAVVVGSPEWRDDLIARGVEASKIFCVPYGVDADLFQPPTTEQRRAIRRKLRIDAGATAVGFFGKNSSNDDDRKGIDVFTKAAIELNRKSSNLVILIIGPGWQQLKSSLSAAGVQCIWIPFVAELGELSEMYQALDFYWVTARVEGGPVTLLEAMSTGVCCLSTPVGLAREVVKDRENALRIAFDDVDAFVERTRALIADDNERARLGANARATILETMHVGITTAGIRAVYQKATDNFSVLHPEVAVAQIPNTSFDAYDNASQSTDAVPLVGFPPSIHRRVEMLESLAWSEHLVLYHRQRSLAFQMIIKAWLRKPASIMPARVFFRRFLPVSLVATVVKLKHGARRAPLVPMSPATRHE